MATRMCLQCHEKDGTGSEAPFCSRECWAKFHAPHEFTVETDIVDPREIASVVKRALGEGWTIIAVTPYKLTKHDVLLHDQRVTDYLIVRSR